MALCVGRAPLFCCVPLVRSNTAITRIARSKLHADQHSVHRDVLSPPAGNTSAKGRIPFLILALLDVLRAFPGQVRGGRGNLCLVQK